jgi:hypothetical protein
VLSSEERISYAYEYKIETTQIKYELIEKKRFIGSIFYDVEDIEG